MEQESRLAGRLQGKIHGKDMLFVQDVKEMIKDVLNKRGAKWCLTSLSIGYRLAANPL